VEKVKCGIQVCVELRILLKNALGNRNFPRAFFYTFVINQRKRVRKNWLEFSIYMSEFSIDETEKV